MQESPIAIINGTQNVSDPVELAWAFPEVNAGQAPFGGRVIVQLRRVRKTAKGSRIILVDETKENEKWQNMIGKVISIGPLAFKNRDTMESWPEGSWAEIGDFVRVPKWGGDRWERSIDGDDAPVLFMTINDHELISRVTDDPLSFNAFI
jgi:co-chaperonin GroES (HSP10)